MMDRLGRDNNHNHRFFVFSGIIVVIVLLLECCSIPGTSGFLLPPHSDSYHRANMAQTKVIPTSTTTATGNRLNHQPSHPRFVASTTTELYGGIFGLGVPELLIIGIAGGVLIGPEKLGKYIGDVTGKLQSEGIPDEFKQIPKEFQKGFEESTTNAKARNAKPMEPIAQPTKKKKSTSSSLPVSPRTMPTQPSSVDDDPN